MAKRNQALAVRHTEVEYLPPASQKERKGIIVDRELERIYEEQGVVSVDSVLAEAASEKSPLHSYFEWDDAKAADRYRRVQAYSMIMASKFVVRLVENGNVEVKTIKESAPVRKLVSAYRGEGFRMRNEVLADNEMRSRVVASKKSVLRSWCQGTIDIPELAELRQVILAKL